MRRKFHLGLLAVLLTIAPVLGPASAQEHGPMNVRAPELKGIEEWLNSKRLELKDLKGKVVVLHFWTFGCINCYHNLPSYAGWQKDFGEKGVTIIGVHTPETAGEKQIEAVRTKVKDYEIKYPVAVDSGGKTWSAWNNRFWPCIYLIDKKGKVRYKWEGELGWNNAKGDEIMRKKIEQLLDEKE